jgi:Flp pilus assembly protein TadB
VLNQSYIEILFREPVGRLMIVAAFVMMVIGMFAMRRMVSIKV